MKKALAAVLVVLALVVGVLAIEGRRARSDPAAKSVAGEAVSTPASASSSLSVEPSSASRVGAAPVAVSAKPASLPAPGPVVAGQPAPASPTFAEPEDRPDRMSANLEYWPVLESKYKNSNGAARRAAHAEITRILQAYNASRSGSDSGVDPRLVPDEADVSGLEREMLWLADHLDP